MPLPIQSFDQIVSSQASAITSKSRQLTDFTTGSILLALVEANAGNSIWIQSLISSLLSVTRLQTSSGSDVDSFINQFNYYRNEGVAAVGVVTFSRSITSSLSYIPASTTLVQTSSSQVLFTTYVDPANAAYDPTTNSYIMGSGVSTLNVPVICTQVGTIGNVLIGQIDTIVTALTNVTGVTNSSAFITGANVASDDQARGGFVLYLAGLSKATDSAIASAVISVPGVSRYSIVENKNEAGLAQLGYFYVVIDNGLGTASMDLRNQVCSAVNLVRGLAIQFNVDKASANVISGITANVIVPKYTSLETEDAITASIQTNIQAFLQTLPIGGTFYFTRVSQIIYDSSPLILDVYNVTLNGSSSADFTSTGLQVPTIVSSTIVPSYENP